MRRRLFFTPQKRYLERDLNPDEPSNLEPKRDEHSRAFSPPPSEHTVNAILPKPPLPQVQQVACAPRL